MKESTVIALTKYFSSFIEVKKNFIGGNSAVYRVSVGSFDVAVKEYFDYSNRKMNLIEREVRALQFLSKHQVPSTPRFIFADFVLGFIAMEFIDGERPVPNKESMESIIEFVLKLDQVYEKDQSFEYAVDAGLSHESLYMQIHRRLGEVNGINLPSLLTKISLISDLLLERAPELESYDRLTYSASDIGLHNTLLSQGSYFYFDLEFFGKDNPLKLVGDFLLHPQNVFSKEENMFFLRKCQAHFGFYDIHLERYVGLLALNWSLICIKRLEKLKSTNAETSMLQAQEDRIRYYVEMAESISQSKSLDMIFKWNR